MVVQIMLIVIVGILLICLAVAAILINMSKRTFVSVYGDSQEKVFYRIEYELNEYHENLQKLFTEVNSSWNLKLYLQEEYETPQDGFQAAYNAEHDMQRAIPSNMDNISVMTKPERKKLSQPGGDDHNSGGGDPGFPGSSVRIGESRGSTVCLSGERVYIHDPEQSGHHDGQGARCYGKSKSLRCDLCDDERGGFPAVL